MVWPWAAISAKTVASAAAAEPGPLPAGMFSGSQTPQLVEST